MQRSYFKPKTNALGSNHSYWLFVFSYLFIIAQALLLDVANSSKYTCTLVQNSLVQNFSSVKSDSSLKTFESYIFCDIF